MDSRDGQAFVKNLAHFVRTHEKALANALQLRRLAPKDPKTDASGASSNRVGAPQSSTSQPSTASAVAAALSLGSLSFSSPNIKNAKLTLTPHHLYYLLARFEELGIYIGPTNVRLESIHADASPANYVSFLSQAQRSKRGSRSDRGSIHSVSSVRSVVSGMSAIWSSFGLGSSSTGAKSEKTKAHCLADLKYLYSAFTKIPCLCLSEDRTAMLIEGYEEFPFDTAVPLLAFKNVSALEISDLDFRQFYGWDRLAEQLRSLSVKRAKIDDPSDLTISIVLDDMDKRRRRSSKIQPSPLPPCPTSPSICSGELARSNSTLSSPMVEARDGQSTSPKSSLIHQRNFDTSVPVHRTRTKSLSPSRPNSISRLDLSPRQTDVSTPKVRRSASGSLDSSNHSIEPFRSGISSNLTCVGILPASKWRFLRHLSIADNSLTSLASSSLAPLANTLHSLDISSNLFTDMPVGLTSLIALRALNVSFCMIESLHSLTRHPMPAITALNLRGNRLVSIAGVERLMSVERLDLRENKIRDPTELARLTEMSELRELWVMGNPFVKSHSNYRVSIFNLFRSTPNHTEDVILDASGPSYSEKRQLRERILKSQPVSVPKPLAIKSFPETGSNSRSPLEEGSDNSIIPPSKRLRRPSLQGTQTDVAAGSRRRRKGTRRRIVDLSRNETSPVVHQLPVKGHNEGLQRKSFMDLTEAKSIESNPALLPPFGHKADSSLLESDHTVISSYPDSAIGVSSRGLSLANEIQSLSLNGEVYRQKVEALKEEVGSNWLNVLNAHGWTEHVAEKSHQPNFHPAHTKSENPHLRVFSENRTLG